jgi:eukaryotic-like serine/threonine-protein kinase
MESWSAKDITPEIWERVKPLFEAASEMAADQRAAFLSQNCPDQRVRLEVEKLLANHDRAGAFLAEPALADLTSVQPPQPVLSPGTLLANRFRVVRFIAGGGMGEVYEAEDEELRERVAVKTIRPDILAQSNALGRFKREVHLARRVTHPNVCRIFDLFRHKPDGLSVQETVFISMELLQGETLAERLKEDGRMSVSEALPLVGQMASALASAHAVGIVHRDFKPGNVVLVGTPGRWRAVVTDFGLALRSVTSDETASLATSQGILGTPAYMSPEQIEGRPATPASDIYAFGLVIYEMVTGERPFRGDTPISAALKRLSEAAIPPREVEPGLSPIWESVILKCLARDPVGRFSNAEEVTTALEGEESGFSPRIEVRKAVNRREMAGLRGKLRKIAVPVLLVGLLVATGVYYRARHPTNRLTEKDTIVLADFANSTGDPIFDDTLKMGLNISLRQSPFLNVLSDSEVARTLQRMTRPAKTKLTPELARELCQRAGSKAYIAGAIGTLGSQYVLGLKAVNCQSGDALAEEQVTAVTKEKVLDTLGEAASKLRGELGESLSTVRKFDVPLSEATTSSLEALKAYSLGFKAQNEKGAAASLQYYQRAIQIDPNFASGYDAVGNDYGNLGERERASEYYTKAFQLQEHASEREKLTIEAHYYLLVTGEQDKAAQTFQEEIESYPRVAIMYNNLGAVYAQQSQYEKAVEITRQGIHLDPSQLPEYTNLANYTLALQRFDETRQVIHEAQTRKLDDFALHAALYALAFLSADVATMAEQEQWFAGKPEENFGLALASDTEAYRGHLGKARELTKRAVDSAIRADSKETGAIWRANAALERAAYGNPAEAQQSAAMALKLAPTSQGVEVEAALAFAMAGDTLRAESLARDLGKRFPLDTQMQSLWLPAIQAQLALDNKNPNSALTALQAASTIELGQIGFVANISCLYQVYIRGEAYLAARQGTAAAAEFQKIIDHSGIVWNCWTGALAHLGVARANTLEARTSQGADADAARVRALAAYKDFLTLWKDADPDIPILKEAKAEYARLQ